MKNNFFNKSLKDIEKKAWTDEVPTEKDSYVFRKAYELYHKKLSDFTDEDLRFIIGQNHYLEYAIPLAIVVLKQNPLAEGDLYPGSLMENVLRADKNYWQNHPGEVKEMEGIVAALEVPDDINYDVNDAFEAFKKNFV